MRAPIKRKIEHAKTNQIPEFCYSYDKHDKWLAFINLNHWHIKTFLFFKKSEKL